MELRELRNLELGEAKLLRLVYRLDEARRAALWSDNAADYQTAEESKSSILALVSTVREDIKAAKKSMRPHQPVEGELEAKLIRLEALAAPPVEETLVEYTEAEAA